MEESYCAGGSRGICCIRNTPCPLSPCGSDQQSCPEPPFSLKLSCVFPTQTTSPSNCCHSFDSTVILISPWGSESDALLVVNSKHERIIINAIIKLITDVKKKQQLFNKTYFTRLKLSKRPRDIYMFWSGKECKNHTDDSKSHQAWTACCS